ncbi:MAG TPA: Ig-like domain-containing protein, partial [Cryptosporangiaceae bacterium]|nr:Ig-like domain-containing protein [Cryptosporangiaceae bacterium]
MLVAALLAVAGCAGPTPAPKASSSPTESTSPTPLATVALTVTPANGAANVVTGPDITLTTDGKVDQVKLIGSDGKPVPGRLSADGLTWTPGTQLAYSTKYKLEVTASKGVDATKTVTSTFTTMDRPGSITGADLYVDDGDTVGVGLPVVVEFSSKVAKNRRAAIERRLFVDSTPAVVGSWHWWSDSEVHYRPKEYWPTGTKVSVRLAVGGMDMGFGRYGKRDRVARFTVGSAVTSRISNAEKRMYVYRNGVLLRSFPISLGRPKFPTPSGTMVVMERKDVATFDSSTYGLPVDSPDGYRIKVNWNTRITWGGIFVHAA